MISELNDEEILEFLMTSDFQDDYKPGELKYLLLKWRYFYRLLHGRLELIKTDKDEEIKKISEELETNKKLLTEFKIKYSKKSDDFDMLKSRKLSLKERFTGKIIIRNEDK